jgi:hypothetical protein
MLEGNYAFLCESPAKTNPPTVYEARQGAETTVTGGSDGQIESAVETRKQDANRQDRSLGSRLSLCTPVQTFDDLGPS